MRERIFLYFLLSLTGFFTALALLMLFPFLKPILWAVIFSLVLYPIHLILSLRIGNTYSALFLTLTVLLIVVIPFSLVLTLAIRQSIDLFQLAIKLTHNGSYIEILNQTLQHPFVKRFLAEEELQKIVSYMHSEEFRNILIAGLRDLAQKGLNFVASLVPALGAFLFKTFVFLLTLFFILRDGPRFVRFAERFLPMHGEDIEQVFLTIYKTVIATVYGSIGVGIAQGVVGFVGYKLVGLDYALLLALSTFISSFVPPFGAGFIWFPVALYTFATEGTYKGAFMFLYGAFAISTIDNFVRPLIMKMGISVPYIVLFFSIVGGLLTFGFVGIFLGPIIFTTLFTLALIYERRILKEGNLTQDRAS
ncbi:MAG: AI-2E family transporter [Aquificaceae bacterium]|nr:AI-2E family transporter [Aquificaceae bacterium]MCX7989089.1 AI-2E family transporter [Aquificaceae bacterium]MDW8293868.1 AI-2E family transporter [Aquificaceae bacterium]